MLKIENYLEKAENEELAKKKQDEAVEINIQEIIPRTTSNNRINSNFSQSKLDIFLKKSYQESDNKEKTMSSKKYSEEVEWNKLKTTSSLKKSSLKRGREENAENFVKDDLKKKKNIK